MRPVRLRLLIALGVIALLALALLGVVFSTGRRLAATRRRLRQALVLLVREPRRRTTATVTPAVA